MIDIAILILINSAVCFGFWNACLYETSKTMVQIGSTGGYTQDITEVKGVLWFVEKWANGKWFYKPLCGCIPCMASFHSIYVYWTFMFITNNISLEALYIYPVYILALSGVNYLIDRE